MSLIHNHTATSIAAAESCHYGKGGRPGSAPCKPGCTCPKHSVWKRHPVPNVKHYANAR